MIPSPMLTIHKVLAIMINNRINICIFAVLPRGSGLRRGTTCERLEVDKGRLVMACRFDPGRTPQRLAPSYLLFVRFQTFFWVFPRVCLLFPSLKVTKSFILLNVDSIIFVTFAASLINKQVIMCQFQVNDSCSITYETIAKAVAFLYGLDVVLIYKLTLK